MSATLSSDSFRLPAELEDLRATIRQISEGTNEVQRMIVARLMRP